MLTLAEAVVMFCVVSIIGRAAVTSCYLSQKVDRAIDQISERP